MLTNEEFNFISVINTIYNKHKTMKNKSRIFLLAMLLFASLNILAQSQTITGTVVDEEGIEVIGATVSVKGSPTSGTMTDIDGKYSIKVNDAKTAILVFTYVGMNPKEVPVAGQSVINVTMESNVVELNEVVAIGYGTVRRKDLTGSVSSLKAGDVEKVPVTNVAQALAGKIPGVQVSAATGAPDATISIAVRGGTSITQSNEPLYIIDGFPSEQGLTGIDPSSIESIDVLKDASSTAIYGARGANGIIVITTKSGQEGKATVSYDMYYGFKKINKRLDVMKPYDFVNMEYEKAVMNNEVDKFENMYGKYADISSNYTNRKGINWQDEIFDSNTPTSMMHKVSVSGGSKTGNYSVSYTRNDDDGIMLESGLSRNAIRMKYQQKVTDRFSFTTNVTWIDEKTKGIGSLNDGGRFSRMAHIWQYRPTIGINGEDIDLVNNDEDPALVDDSGNQMQNPIASIAGEKRNKRNKNLQMNGDITYKILNNLTYKGSIGFVNRDITIDEFHTMRSRKAKNQGAPFGSKQTENYSSVTYNNTLTYTPKINKDHRMDVMVGQEDVLRTFRYFSASSSKFPVDNFGIYDLSLGEEPGKPQTNKEEERMFSFFGRVNYQYLDKYLFTATMRADGSSKFGDDNKWGYFPSVSAAWRASEEEFIKNLDIFSNLKVRASYGAAGNNNIPRYRSLSLYTSNWTPMNNQAVPIYSGRMANPGLKWETTYTTNLGMDLSFFNHKVQATLDFYNTQTKDLLLDAQIPYLSGYKSIFKNIGETRNRGIEFSVTTYNIQNKDFTWTTSFNIAANRNKVMKLADSDQIEWKSGWNGDFNDADYLLAVGQPLGQMYGYEYDGIYTVDQFDYVNGQYVLKAGETSIEGVAVQPGYFRYKNQNPDEDNMINSKDKKVIGKASPKFFGGINNNFTYKGFDLSIFLNFSVGNDIYNANRMFADNLTPKLRNSMTYAKDRFTFIDAAGNNLHGNPTALAQLNEGKTMASVQGVGSNMKFHSLYVDDGSFLRINNITFGYTIPKKLLRKASIQNLRVYASGYNLYTFTKYKGYDPEVNTNPNQNLTPGVDWGAYPRALSFVFGLNLTF